MKVSTYNVNSVNARLENLSEWLTREQPDIVLLQEIKCEYDAFPFFEIKALGYDAKILGEKSYNGVAVLSRHKMRITAEGLPGFTDEHSRYLEVEIDVGGKTWRVASVYLPNGNPPYNKPDDTSKFEYKLRWTDALYQRAEELKASRQRVILGGDFNVILTDNDVYNPEAFRNNALFRPEVVTRLKAIEYLGFYDAYRMLHPSEVGYTYWDYAGNAFPDDMGMRIDYQWLSPSAVDKLISATVDKSPRRAAKPSDHTPLTTEFNNE